MDSAHVKVLIVDDHDLFRIGLRALLEEEDFEVADAAGGAAGVRRARGFAPEVVVMDMNMPGMSGVEATPLMLEAAPRRLDPDADRRDGRGRGSRRDTAGASGYLLKDAELSDIVAGIRAAAAGHSTIAARVAGHLLLSVRNNDSGPPTTRRRGPDLSGVNAKCSRSSPTAATTPRLRDGST